MSPVIIDADEDVTVINIAPPSPTTIINPLAPDQIVISQQEETEVVVACEPETSIVMVGIQGPRGPTGIGQPSVFVGPTQPVAVVGEYVWFQTDGDGVVLDILSGEN